jgi:hypothetical protein
MKNRTLAAITIALGFLNTQAQDTTQTKSQLYTGFYNQLSGDIKYPVLGVVNMVDGNQKGTQIGVSNFTKQNVDGFQMGLTNIMGGSGTGAQLGLVNVTKDSFSGAQISYINITGKQQQGVQVGFINLAQSCNGAAQIGTINASAKETKGVQIGYINVAGKDVDGGQVGFINTVGGSAKGGQVAFVNATAKNVNGAQVAFVNVAGGKTSGAQVGYINVGKTIKGTQVGFINIADSFSSGMPVGFLSIVRKGGYYAFELSSNELYYYNAAVKIGVKPLYTSFGLSYNPQLKNEFAWNVGLGSMLYATRHFFLNPEITIIGSIENNPQYFTQLSTSLGFSFGPVAIKAGPTFTWSYLDTDNSPKTEISQKAYQPQYSFYKNQIDAQNSFWIGAKASIVFSF